MCFLHFATILIGHLKSDFRLSRNFLKGDIGNDINLLMAACVWNLRKWMASYITLFFVMKNNAIFESNLVIIVKFFL